jgi:hypothetical protein
LLAQPQRRFNHQIEHGTARNVYFVRPTQGGGFWIKAAIIRMPIITKAEQSFSPLRKTSGSEALPDVFFFKTAHGAIAIEP